MKIRFGFVSNSSTTSFLIYGTKIEDREFMEDFEYDDEQLAILKDEGLQVFYGYEDRYIGASWDAVQDDETGLQFKQRVEQAVRSIPGINQDELRFKTHAEAYRDG